MPTRLPHPCAVTGCSRLVVVGARCEIHKLPPRKDLRESAGHRGYGYKWSQIRREYIRAHPFCSDPYSLHLNQKMRADMVDHIVPKRQGGSDSMSNLQSLCNRCHQYKTSKDGSRGGW